MLEQTLRLAHPFIPFVTEEIWQMLPIEREKPSIMISSWPVARPADAGAEQSFDRVSSVVSAIRSFRSEYGISPKVRLSPTATSDDAADREALDDDRVLISRLAGLGDLIVVRTLDRDAGRPGNRRKH